MLGIEIKTNIDINFDYFKIQILNIDINFDIIEIQLQISIFEYQYSNPANNINSREHYKNHLRETLQNPVKNKFDSLDITLRV